MVQSYGLLPELTSNQTLVNDEAVIDSINLTAEIRDLFASLGCCWGLDIRTHILLSAMPFSHFPDKVSNIAI